MKKQRNNSNITNNNSNSFTYFNGNKCFCNTKNAVTKRAKNVVKGQTTKQKCYRNWKKK